jgi:hypothetical protein
MLVNSPMNEPTYRSENAIEVIGEVVKASGRRQSPALVISTTSFSQSEYEEMKRLRHAYLLAENFGILRQVMRFVRQETGMREIDFLVEHRRVVCENAQRWPISSYTFESVPMLMAPPASWGLFIEELHDYVVEHVNLADDSALATVLAVQHALLPARDRPFPVEIELAHDYPAWHRAMMDAKIRGFTQSWPDMVPRLCELGPGTFEVQDPDQVCQQGLGFGIDFVDIYENWELASPTRRAVVSHRTAF